MLPLPNVLQMVEQFLPVWPMGSSDHLPDSGSLPSFPTKAPPSPPGHDPGDSTDFQNIRICTLLLMKTSYSQPSPFPNVLGIFFFLMQSPTCAFARSLSLFLSCSSLYDQGCLSFTEPTVLSFPKSTFCGSYLLQCGYFSTSSCAVLFFKSSK